MRFCALLACVVLVALLAGCKTAPAASNRPPIDAKPLLLAMCLLLPVG
jgi:predicted component of type VI protein secretion system